MELHKVDKVLFAQMVVTQMLSRHRILTQVAGHAMDVIKSADKFFDFALPNYQRRQDFDHVHRVTRDLSKDSMPAQHLGHNHLGEEHLVYVCAGASNPS